jgi:deazaflavin-dependent oxidoreductase (nitroreductase family)
MNAPVSRLNRATRALARATMSLWRPMSGRRWLPLWAMLHQRGRKSGREYAIPVAVRASDDAFFIALPWGDATQWVRNVQAAGGCTLRWRGRDYETDAPQIVGRSEAAPAYSWWQRVLIRVLGVQQFLRLRHMPSST